MDFYFVVTMVFAWLLRAPAILALLWNMTVPDVFGCRSISYWQAFRLILIVAILTGGAQFNVGA